MKLSFAFCGLIASTCFAIAGLDAANPAHAGYNCYTDALGTTRCRGTIDGQRVNTSSYTDALGTTRTRGTIGGSSFTQSCYTDALGTTRCR